MGFSDTIVDKLLRQSKCGLLGATTDGGFHSHRFESAGRLRAGLSGAVAGILQYSGTICLVSVMSATRIAASDA